VLRARVVPVAIFLGAAVTAAARLPTSADAGAGRLERIRDAVVRGVARDFAQGTGIGGPSFQRCVEGRLRQALDAPTITRLVAIFRGQEGTAGAAQLLNRLAAPLAGRCGHRYWVPELVEAANGLRSAGPNGAVTERLGVTYGPYLGKRCRNVAYPRCELIGVDIAFGRSATRVEAIAGAQRIHLRTPGKHSGIPRKDWVGTFTATDLARTHDSANRSGKLLYVPVKVHVHFADGHRARAVFPHVLVAPGWG
jgi:hypothetical protein